MIFVSGLFLVVFPLVVCMMWPGLVSDSPGITRGIMLSMVLGALMMIGSVLYWMATNLP